jgi:hypothetical protein
MLHISATSCIPPHTVPGITKFTVLIAVPFANSKASHSSKSCILRERSTYEETV